LHEFHAFKAGLKSGGTYPEVCEVFHCIRELFLAFCFACHILISRTFLTSHLWDLIGHCVISCGLDLSWDVSIDFKPIGCFSIYWIQISEKV
jgi:hypothetical protein